jgi:hypothetical protein
MNKESVRMDKSNIVTNHIIPGIEVAPVPIGLVGTDEFKTPDEVLDDAVKIGNQLGADWIVGFNLQSQQTEVRANRTWSGFGTAVKLNL